MVVITNKKILFGAFLLIIIGYAAFFILPNGYQNPNMLTAPYNTPLGTLSIYATLPESPSSITLYQVIRSENDMAYYSTDDWIVVRPNVTSETDAPKAAEAALVPYGGLPQGAELVYNKTEYIETKNTVTRQVTAKHPVTTNVQYARFIDDKPVVGPGGFIYIDLGNDGELHYLNKVWRNVTPSETIPIISASTALDKVKRGELFGQRSQCSCELFVNKIGLGYYEYGRNETQDFLEPVWIFSGNLSSGDPWKYFVYARESADSTRTTTSGLTQPLIHANETPIIYLTNKFSGQTDSKNTIAKTEGISR